MANLSFKVIDKLTGQEADIEKIARSEECAKGLIACDMEGFALEQFGNLLLLDQCGNFAYCPEDRFEVEFEESGKIASIVKTIDDFMENIENKKEKL